MLTKRFRRMDTIIVLILAYILPNCAAFDIFDWPFKRRHSKKLQITTASPDTSATESTTNNGSTGPWVTTEISLSALEVTTIETSLSTPAVTTTISTTTMATTYTTTSTSEITVINSTLLSQQSNSTNPTTNMISPLPTHVNLTTFDINLKHADELKGNNGTSANFPGPQIGIGVGIAAVATLLTILILCICWRLQIRRNKNLRNQTSESSEGVSNNFDMTQVCDLKNPARDRGSKPLQTNAFAPPNLYLSDRNSHGQPTGHYIDIDITSSMISNPNIAFISSRALPSIVEDNHNFTKVEVLTEERNGEYSLCKEDAASLGNEVCQDKRAKVNQLLVQSPLRDNQIPGQDVDNTYTEVKPVSDHVPLRIGQDVKGASGASGLYTKLGVSTVTLENTYNSLQNRSDEEVAEPNFTKPNEGDKRLQGQQLKTAAQPNPVPISPGHLKKEKTLEIVDVSPYEYATVIIVTK